METDNHINKEEEVLNQLSASKIILPIVLGILVIMYLVFRNFNLEEFQTIKWNRRLWTYLSIALLIYVVRHILISIRLKFLSDGKFTFKHSVELIAIWEFASSISPTSLGGSAVAVFFLSQEKISGAKAVSIVLYTVILDTLFFLISMVILLYIFGPTLVRPNMTNMFEWGGILFMVVWLFMLTYGIILVWGLYRPRVIRSILHFMAKLPLIRRFKKTLYQTGIDVVTTSQELRTKPFSFHFKATMLTLGGWITRFLCVNFVILAIVEMDWEWMNQFLLYARSQTMYVMTQFSPTPGGAGVMEASFAGFFSDFVSKSVGTIGALLWRIITYYPYLIIGAFIIPNWVNRVLKIKRNRKRSAAKIG